MIRNFCSFNADFPDDSQENERDDIEIPAGRNLAAALVESLRGSGVQVSDPYQHSFYGWAVDIRTDKCTIQCLIQNPQPWLLIVEARRSLGDRMTGKRHDGALSQALHTIQQAMNTDPRFTPIGWYTRQEFESR
jgi:hypothetical protein